MSNPLKFSSKLKLYRRMKDLNVSDAAKMSGMPTARYEDIESGQHEPRAGDILRIMHGLGIRLEPEDFEEVSQ